MTSLCSGESASGLYPFASVQMMDKIIRMAEKNLEEDIISVPHVETMALMCESALYLSVISSAKALITISTLGSTPRILATYRGNIPIVAACTNTKILNRAMLYYSNYPILIEHPVRETEPVFHAIEKQLKDQGLVKKGDIMVFVFGYPVHGKHRTNTIRRWVVDK